MATSADPPNSTPRLRVLMPLTGLANLAAGSFKPIAGMVGVAAGAGISVERRVVDRVIASARVQAALITALSSDAAGRLVDAAFDSGLIDRVVERLPTSRAVWDLID